VVGTLPPKLGGVNPRLVGATNHGWLPVRPTMSDKSHTREALVTTEVHVSELLSIIYGDSAGTKWFCISDLDLPSREERWGSGTTDKPEKP